ncbi:hypothetical protein PHJA_002076900 [Phtheirospermum japonicum]|uniref:C2 domain-containing protein n=1 Tax=Phtheirospermum japonicum TaxID=374723 RepID=A0A830CPA6_9LAMI|nr:hypothetical protein PHJA_002076900 [Phtheirospermum japonicum]
MDSPQSVVSPLKSSSVLPEHEKQSNISGEIKFQSKDTTLADADKSLGALEVHIHQARDIHNICIYAKQDVYAKICLTSDPEKTVATKINIGGGRNPVFNETLSLNVRNFDSSLKCELWMLSRVRNYLEDQLLGFALVPISEILLNDGKLEKEYTLSSTDLFHSPAGFVKLSVSYVGAPPDVFPIPSPQPKCAEEADSVNKSVKCELDNIEFPDPKVANENHQMVEEYFEICTKVDSQCSESLVSSDTENHVSSEETGDSGPLKIDSPLSSLSTTEISASFESSETPKGPKSPVEEHISPPLKDNSKEKSDVESNASGGDTFGKPLVSVSIEPEPQVVQQDIVDMYMKSMQQFTESLAKMKLPMDYENGPSSSENSTTSDQKTPTSKNSGSRVFYGSRAFF